MLRLRESFLLALFKPDTSATQVEVSTYPRRLSSNHFLVTFPLTCMQTQHPNNVVDMTLFQLYCHLASNPIVNAASRRLSTRPDDLTQVLVAS